MNYSLTPLKLASLLVIVSYLLKDNFKLILNTSLITVITYIITFDIFIN